MNDVQTHPGIMATPRLSFGPLILRDHRNDREKTRDKWFSLSFLFCNVFLFSRFTGPSLHRKQPMAFHQPGIVDAGKLVYARTTSLHPSLSYAFLVFGESLVAPCPRSAAGQGYDYSLTLTHTPFLCLSLAQTSSSFLHYPRPHRLRPAR